jgi:hypothetical protein
VTAACGPVTQIESVPDPGTERNDFMKRLKSMLFAAAAAVALAGGTAARADINWTIDWTPSNSSVLATNGTVIKFSNLGPSAQTTSAILPVSGFTATNLSIGPLGTLPDNLGASGQNYQMQAKITDQNGTSQTAFLSGTLMGTITSKGAFITNLYTVPSATLTFNETDGSKDTYVINLGQFTQPGTNTLNTVGGIGATVAVTNTGGTGSGAPHGTPEPSTMALGGLGMFFTGLMGWRRRNRNAALVG